MGAGDKTVQHSEILKLAPHPVIKPWGWRHDELLRCTGIAVGVGELWLASAQTGPGNHASRIVEPQLELTLVELLGKAAAEGDAALRRLIGERGLGALRQTPHRGKTEAWVVREVSGRAGFASGPRTAQQRDRLKALVLSGGIGPDVERWDAELRELFGIVEPVRAGDVFLVPCGTLHTMFALGEDARLVIDEIQQGYGTSLLPTLSKILLVQDSILSVQVHPCDETVQRAAAGELDLGRDLEANPTVRVTDFGRRPGEEPELGFELTRLDAGLRRVTPLEAPLDGGGRLAVLVACRCFVRKRLSLPAGGEADLRPEHGSYRVLHCLRGAAVLSAGARERAIAAGETAFVPAELEAAVRVAARAECELLDDAVADMDALADFMVEKGVSQEQVQTLLAPPRAIYSSLDQEWDP